MKKIILYSFLICVGFLSLSSFAFWSDDENPLSIYPNPARQHLTIAYKTSGSDEVPVIRILDLTGKTVKTVEKELTFEEDMYRVKLDIDDLNTGVYFVKVELKEKSFSKKLLVR